MAARPARATRATLRVVPPIRHDVAPQAGAAGPGPAGAAAGAGEAPAYQQLAADLRQAAVAGRYPPGQRLPTEAELVASTGLSRQTVRRAFQELVSEGVIYRVRGRGTFAVPGDGRYLRSFGSIDD